MTKKQHEMILKHGAKLLKLYPECVEQDAVKLCKKLRILENQAGAIALRLCNGPEYPGGYDEVDKRCETILAKVRAILGDGPAIFINRDPRGYALKIKDAHEQKLDIEQDWGGHGIIAPELK
jgi:hypothetical protein